MNSLTRSPPEHNVTVEESQADLFFDISLSLQISIASIATLVNSVLLYGQAKALNWPLYQRLLFLNVSAAAAISSLIHTGQACIQFRNHITDGRGDLEGTERWSDYVGDSAQTAVGAGMVILAFQNYFALRQCERQVISHKTVETSQTRKIFYSIALIILVWAVATGVVCVGLNPQAQVYDEQEMANVMSYVSLLVGLSMEVSVACVIFATHRVLRQLQTDFAIRRAQQSLAVRVHINQTISLTSAISRVLVLHVTIWTASLALGFSVNRILKSMRTSLSEDVTQTRLAAFTALIDDIPLSFNLVYPFLVAWKQPQLQRRMISAIRCRFATKLGDIKQTVAVTLPTIQVADLRNSPTAHHDAIEGVWQRVADANKLPRSKPGNPGQSPLKKAAVKPAMRRDP